MYEMLLANLSNKKLWSISGDSGSVNGFPTKIDYWIMNHALLDFLAMEVFHLGTLVSFNSKSPLEILVHISHASVLLKVESWTALLTGNYIYFLLFYISSRHVSIAVKQDTWCLSAHWPEVQTLVSVGVISVDLLNM